jgi:ectoine hydroxylase-related dioxygenase (phytanoyl-CoA dioxygenase family)
MVHDPSDGPIGADQLLGPNCEKFIRQYHERGYVVCRNFCTENKIAEYRAAIQRIIRDWPDKTDPKNVNAESPPLVDYDPRVVCGEVDPASAQFSVLRLFRIATHEPVFHRLCTSDQAVLSFMKRLLGDDLKLVQSMALLKPPGTGEKRWHQDQAVFRLTPNSGAVRGLRLMKLKRQMGACRCGQGCNTRVL